MTKAALQAFERIVRPAKVEGLTTATIDQFVAARKVERGRKAESTVSPATVNRELRHVKALLRIAQEWGYLRKVPRIRMLRTEQRIGAVNTPEHFQAIYKASDVATMPQGLSCPPADWWRALLIFALSTGWRISEILTLRRDDLDIQTGAVVTRAANNKARRDDADFLPDVALEHVKAVVGFYPLVFVWPHHERTLWLEFQRIQAAAGIKLVCPDADRHVCTDACHYYGFHAIRRGYATLNADSMSAPVLQAKMRHKSYLTTLGYISLANKLKKASQSVYVPEFLRQTAVS